MLGELSPELCTLNAISLRVRTALYPLVEKAAVQEGRSSTGTVPGEV